MTRGGPGTATQIFATYSYQVAFGQLRWGRGVTICLFVVPILVLGIVMISRYLLRDPRFLGIVWRMLRNAGQPHRLVRLGAAFRYGADRLTAPFFLRHCDRVGHVQCLIIDDHRQHD